MAARYIIGFMLILLGIVYLLEQLAILPPVFLAAWWPVLVILYGLNGLLRRPTRPWGSLIIILIGAVLQLWILHILLTFWPIVLALALILLGLRLLIPRRPRWSMPMTPVKDRIDDAINFESRQFRDESQQFQGGRLSASFSNYELDLRGATLVPGGADLDVTVSFGGIQVRVPESWSVVVIGTPVFGSCTNKTRRPAPGAAGEPVLRVKCDARFGSVEITN